MLILLSIFLGCLISRFSVALFGVKLTNCSLHLSTPNQKPFCIVIPYYSPAAIAYVTKEEGVKEDEGFIFVVTLEPRTPYCKTQYPQFLER